MRIYKNKFGQWETLFKNKMMNGETIYYNQSVRFARGKEPQKESIDISFDSKDFFGSVYHSDKTNKDYPILVIMDWVEEEPKMMMKPDGSMVKESEFTMNPALEIKEDDLPFY